VSSEWLNVAGLLLDVVGATVLAWGLLIGKDRAIELGVSRYAGDTREELLQLPAVADRLRQARNAAVGTVLLVAGFLCQIVASWPA
jgi:hypothetical protein